MRTGLLLSILLVGAGLPAHAQVIQPIDVAVPAAANQSAAPTAPADASQEPQKDPAATPAKPTRSFLGALVHNLGDDVKHIPRPNTAYWLVGGGALALAAHQADNKLNRHLRGSRLTDNFFTPGKYLGSTYVQIGTSLTTYIVGRAKGQPRTQHIGMDMIEAQIITEALVEGLKLAVRRDRPANADGTSTSTSKTYSFPSGHAAVTFATATVFQQHFGWKAAIPTYALATYVATSRLHDNRHYLSDVVFGSTVGIIVGRSVTWHGRNTFTVSAAPMPGGLGAYITW